MLIGARQAMWGGAAPAPTPAYWGLCFTAEQANSTVAMAAANDAPSVNLLYSTDGANWAPFVVGTTTVTLASVGDKVWLKAGTGGNTATCGTIPRNFNYFSLSGLVAASGSVMSLLNGDEETYAFSVGFAFSRLFQNCTALTAAPELPATTLMNQCYVYMFNGCTALTAAPLLPATTLATSCYGRMFYGCSSLNSIKVKFTSFTQTGISTPTNTWVSGVAASGTFYCPTALGTNETISRSATYCPAGWTVINTDAA